MGFPKTYATVYEKRVVFSANIFDYRLGSRESQFIKGSNHKVIQGVFGIKVGFWINAHFLKDELFFILIFSRFSAPSIDSPLRKTSLNYILNVFSRSVYGAHRAQNQFMIFRFYPLLSKVVGESDERRSLTIFYETAIL